MFEAFQKDQPQGTRIRCRANIDDKWLKKNTLVEVDLLDTVSLLNELRGTPI